jgi:hypothetical protein
VSVDAQPARMHARAHACARVRCEIEDELESRARYAGDRQERRREEVNLSLDLSAPGGGRRCGDVGSVVF